MSNLAVCRHCGQNLTATLVDLGMSPLANSFVPPERAGTPCPTYPLHARVCSNCFLVQVEDAVPADEIFSSEYAYFSSFSDSWLDHSRAYVDAVTERFGLDGDSLVMEIASNDGYLLQYFVEQGVPVLGVEPAANVAKVAENRGVATRVDFFGDALASTLVFEGLRPALICSANVLAHVPDINDFVAGLARMLSGDAVYSVEFPHLLSLISKVQFDTIYHEHYTYLSLVSVERIFADAGLRVFDVEELATHGGSLRVYACLDKAGHVQCPSVIAVREKEHLAELDTLAGYQGFETKVEKVKSDLNAFLHEAKISGKTVAAYGAAAKGNTLLNYCGVSADMITYCVDKNPVKQHTLLPGSHIPVFGPDHLRQHRPDYVLILPWNLKSEISEQLKDLGKLGTQFVVPVPYLEIFGG